MRFAYGDPPYLGCCAMYEHFHPDGLCWNDLDTHRALITRMDEFDAWALSLTSNSLRSLLPLCPDGVRVGAWVKPFASWKPGVNPAYCWEPVIFSASNLGRGVPTMRDFISEPVRLNSADGAHTPGAKPWRFSWWIFDMLGASPDDEFVDLFEGSGAVGRAWDAWRTRGRVEAVGLFDEAAL